MDYFCYQRTCLFACFCLLYAPEKYMSSRMWAKWPNYCRMPASSLHISFPSYHSFIRGRSKSMREVESSMTSFFKGWDRYNVTRFNCWEYPTKRNNMKWVNASTNTLHFKYVHISNAYRALNMPNTDPIISYKIWYHEYVTQYDAIFPGPDSLLSCKISPKWRIYIWDLHAKTL